MFSKFTQAVQKASICGEADEPGGFDPVAAGSIWELDVQGVTALHGADHDLPATLIGRSGRQLGDYQVAFQILREPPGAFLQFGLCNGAHPPGSFLGWAGSAAVGSDGRIRYGGGRQGGWLGPLTSGDVITVRLRHSHGYSRREPDGLWNGVLGADPGQDIGGLPLEIEGELFPAIFADTRGARIRADFSRWDLDRQGFDPNPGRTSLSWEVSEDRLSAVHRCAEDAPATLMGARGYRRGDHEVVFRLEQLPAAGMIQCGLSNTDHLLDNELGWRNSVGVGPDGFVRLGGVTTTVQIGPFRERDTVAVRLKHGHAYFRRGPTGLWNGDPAADPDRDRGGLLLGLAGELRPAVYAERPGTRLCADFSRWLEAAPRPPVRRDAQLFDLAAGLTRGRGSDDDWRSAGGD